jgi:hypothetical protein
MTAPWVWAQQNGANDEFVRPPAETVTPDEPDPMLERSRNDAANNGLSNDWVRDESDRSTAMSDPPPRSEPPEDPGLERAREKADEHAQDTLERNADRDATRDAEKAADEEIDRTAREKDRPGAGHRSAMADEDGE